MTKKLIKRATKCDSIPINKVGDYNEGDDGNITLPMEFNDIKSLAILDSGARVAIELDLPMSRRRTTLSSQYSFSTANTLMSIPRIPTTCDSWRPT